MATERLYGDPSEWDHAVAHVDMDAFYVSVELLDRPDLRGKPVVVGPTDPSFRGVVMTASYEARRFGVHSALPMAIARRRCPKLIVLPRNMERYREKSAMVMKVLRRFSDLVEVVGMDEAYIDLGGSPAPKTRARQIKAEVLAATGLTCSIGLGPNRLVAKIASDLDKPDGLCVLPRERFLEVVGGEPVRTIPGIGPRTEERLAALEIETISDLAGAPESSLATILGPRQARSLGRRACGFGGADVAVERERKSESRERTFASDRTDPTEMRTEITTMARAVAGHLGEQHIRGKTVTLKIRLAPFRTFTRSRTLSEPTSDPAAVVRAALELFDAFERDAPVRLLGVGVSNLARESQAEDAGRTDDGTGAVPGSDQSATEAGPVQLALG
jgi:DNA polymerase IV